MRTIDEGQAEVRRILGEQKVIDADYRPMRYIISVKCPEGTLLHNVLTGQLVLLNASEERLFCDGTTRYNDVSYPLIRDYFFVPDHYREKETVDKLRRIVRRVHLQRGTNGYVLLTTTNCNARCFYCFQSGCDHVNMSSSTASSIVSYMLSNRSEGPLRLRWFGGEPLLGMDRIDQICEMLREADTEFISTMISNGYLFNQDVIRKAKEVWHLSNVQITLDGTEDVYNAVKRYVVTADSPFQTVMGNIEGLLESDIRVTIRLNLDQHNKADLKELVDYLLDRLSPYDKYRIYVNVLFENEGYSPIARSREQNIELHSYKNWLNEYITSRGVEKRDKGLPSLSAVHCMADGGGTVVVYPDGRLFRCEHTREGDAYGDIWGSFENPENVEKFRAYLSFERCAECELYPSCILLRECTSNPSTFTDVTCEYERHSARQVVLQVYNKQHLD